MKHLIEFSHVCKYYQMGETQVKAVDDISFSVDEGEFVAVVGQSGSGKSTCMNILGCLDEPTDGCYRLLGKDVSELNSNELSDIRLDTIGFIFQHYNLLNKLSSKENVELPLVYKGEQSHSRSIRALECLKKVGLEDKAHNFPNQLSGGEQQRVSIARAIANSPKLILADEPTGALDSKTGEEVMELLKDLNKEGVTVILITHNVELSYRAGRIITLRDGRMIADEKRKTVE